MKMNNFNKKRKKSQVNFGLIIYCIHEERFFVNIHHVIKKKKEKKNRLFKMSFEETLLCAAFALREYSVTKRTFSVLQHHSCGLSQVRYACNCHVLQKSRPYRGTVSVTEHSLNKLYYYFTIVFQRHLHSPEQHRGISYKQY